MKFRSVSLPEPLVDEVEAIINNFQQLGYTSIADAVKEAVREWVRKTKDEIRQGWRGSWAELTQKMLELDKLKEN